MTDNSPSLWAAADLDPISPSPVYPPSPIIVPALQDQAEAYFDMSSTDNNLATLAMTTTARASEIGAWHDHAQMAAPITYNKMANGVPDTSLSEVEGMGLEKATNGVAQRAETSSISISAGDMQEPETSPLEVTEAEQDVSQSNKLIPSSKTSASVRDVADVATPPHKSTPPTSRSSDAIPSLLPQTFHHKLPRDNQVILDGVTSVADSTQLSPPPSEQPTANKNLGSSTTSHANRRDTDIQALLDDIANYAADANAAHIPASESASSGDGIIETTILRPELSSPDLTSTQSNPYLDELASCIPGTFQSSSVPLPSSNGSALATYSRAAPGAYIDTAQETVEPYSSATVTRDATSMPSHAVSLAQSDSTSRSLPVEQTPLTNHTKKDWETFLREERKYVSEAKWDRFPEGSRIFIGSYTPSSECSSFLLNK